MTRPPFGTDERRWDLVTPFMALAVLLLLATFAVV